MQSPKQQAQSGLAQIEDAILAILKKHPDGLTNAEIAKELGIETGEHNEHRNMLSWSIIGRLVKSARVDRIEHGARKLIRLK